MSEGHSPLVPTWSRPARLGEIEAELDGLRVQDDQDGDEAPEEAAS
jgi:hypothetical protein